MRTILAAALCFVGCGGDAPKAVPPTKPSASEFQALQDVNKERTEAIRKDRPRLIREAANHVRRSAAASFGIEEAKAAKITAEESAVKDLGPEKWKVEGVYDGGDEIGRRFTASFAVTLGLAGSELSCDEVELGERKYKAQPTSPNKTAK